MDGSPTDAFTTAQSRRTVLVAGALGGDCRSWNLLLALQ